MKGFSTKTASLVFALAMVAIFAGIWFISPFWSTSKEGMVIIQGNTPVALSQAQLIRHDDQNKQVEVVIGLKLRNESQLDNLIARQSDPTSPDFRKFISPDQFVRDYAPTQKDVDTLVAYLTKNGLKVSNVSPNRLLVHVQGTVAQLEATFKIAINVYQVGNQQAFSNDRDPSVPADLKDVVGSVIGLNSIEVYHSRMAHAGNPPATPPKRTTPLGYGPRDLATAYNYPNVNNRNGGAIYSGKGVTIAIASAYDYLDTDVQAYWNYYHIHRTGTVSRDYVNGQSNQLDGETTLDLEQSAGQAPGADVIMYLGNDPGFSSFAQVFNKIVTDNKASVASVSWGLCEADTGKAEIATEHVIFKEGVAQGITWFAAAGDDGAYDCRRKKPMVSADYPASDPFVTAVGGTTLKVDAKGSRVSETAWSGAGGATSIKFYEPAWQYGPGVPQNNRRNTSDISLNADPYTGDSLFFQGSWDGAGGTSFASPDEAGLWALAVEANGGRLGYAAPTLYRILRSSDYGKVFFDVTAGNNGGGNGAKYPGFPATTGWDHPTGVGSPDGNALIDWLLNDQRSSANPSGTPLSFNTPLSK